jgi:hypothetical protein
MTRTRTHTATLLTAAVALLSACSDHGDSGAAAAPTSKPTPSSTVTATPGPVITSPSGLPVGLLEGKVARTSGASDVSTVRLLVRADGSGVATFGSGYLGGSSKDVEYVALGPGRVALKYDGVVCADPRALTLGFRVEGHDLTITDTHLRGCFTSKEMTADLVGATMHINPLPPGSAAPGNG